MSGAVRYDQWMRRIHLQQLAAWGEHWADLRGTAQYAAWCRLAEERRAAADVDYYMARGLLAEVIYAAGGVERELERLRAAMAEVQRFADESRALYPLPPAKEWPPWGRHVAAPAMREASYSFANLLSWARSTVERTDRPFKPGGNERAGLLPALAAGQLRDNVSAALRELKHALQDSRHLVNYALHAGAVPGGGSPRAEYLPDGRLIARVPDKVKRPILAWEQFTFAEDRDMLTYGEELIIYVERFVDKVLDAFAADRPARVGPLPRWPC